MTTTRGAYRPKREVELEAIEARRIAGGFTIDELARKAGITDRTYRNAMRSGRTFKRTLVALQMALRTLESERKREGDVFPFEMPGRTGQASPDGSRAAGAGSAPGSLGGSRSPAVGLAQSTGSKK